MWFVADVNLEAEVNLEAAASAEPAEESDPRQQRVQHGHRRLSRLLDGRSSHLLEGHDGLAAGRGRLLIVRS